MEEMEYNTTRGKLILPEYGRNVQNMISHAMELEDRIERNRAAQAIIDVMGQLNPHSSSIKYGHYGKYTQAILEASRETTDPKEKEYLKTSMANFMKKQYLSHNNDAVENNVIAENLKELSKGDLILENPDDLVNTSTILREMGLNKKFTKPNNNFKQKKKFKKQ